MSQFYYEAKKRVQKLVDLFEGIKTNHKKTRLSPYGKKSIKIMKDFIKCNITDPAISKKYSAVTRILDQYATNKTKLESTVAGTPENSDNIQ